MLLISEEVSPQERKKLAIKEGQFIHIDALEHEHYLQYHRSTFLDHRQLIVNIYVQLGQTWPQSNDCWGGTRILN